MAGGVSPVKWRRQIRLHSSSSLKSEHQLGRHADCSKMVTNADEQGNSMSMKATVNLLDLRNMFLLYLAAKWQMSLNEADECCEKIGNVTVTERELRL